MFSLLPFSTFSWRLGLLTSFIHRKWSTYIFNSSKEYFIGICVHIFWQQSDFELGSTVFILVLFSCRHVNFSLRNPDLEVAVHGCTAPRYVAINEQGQSFLASPEIFRVPSCELHDTIVKVLPRHARLYHPTSQLFNQSTSPSTN